ncbi:MAG: hypothetical protein L7F78_18195, partial [Syntrophales bacterium LBB04]|nr:hypothetical protein [Syntrophales bacterium LBB04]
MSQKLNSRLVADILVLLAVEGVLFSFLKPAYLFSPTITAGGDTASHYYTAWYLKEYLLPHFKISGWTPGNYAGFPMLQLYFPLPFFLMVVLSLVIPLQVAFKVVTVLGIFLLPVFSYISLRLLRYESPVPVVGAMFSLLYLFVESHHSWGGNIAGVLTGEFPYSISFTLAVLFVGTLYRGIESGSRLIWNALLLASVGFCHGYGLLYSGFVSLFFLLTRERFLKNIWYLCRMHALAFLFMGVWIVPLLYYMPATTPFYGVWQIGSVYEI